MSHEKICSILLEIEKHLLILCVIFVCLGILSIFKVTIILIVWISAFLVVTNLVGNYWQFHLFSNKESR